ncbi:MAG: class I SAM-dependent methyltransferase [Taibaiella sp.]|nr:class I SAM-dependent methyltransferase [Taibaiella sp.]
MALKQHLDYKVRFDQQVENSASYVLPFIEETKQVGSGMQILEIGTGEGGVLLPFMERGCHCVGVDLAPERIDIANELLEKQVKEGKAEFLCINIFDEPFLKRFKGIFDVIILKDVIEHVHQQEEFIPYLKKLLKPGGQVFFGFPPWYMPFGGHQQTAHKKWVSVLPYYHILPNFLYKGILKLAGEHPAIIADLMEVKETRITIERFERIVKESGYKILKKQHYLINPIYKYKFGLKPRVQWTPITYIPFLRNFVTTCVYYTIG